MFEKIGFYLGSIIGIILSYSDSIYNAKIYVDCWYKGMTYYTFGSFLIFISSIIIFTIIFWLIEFVLGGKNEV